MKVNKLLMSFAAALVALAACEEYDQGCYYPAPEPKSEIGKMLTANTKYIYSIYNDESYQLHQGVEVTELAYLNNEGRSMRTFWYKIDLTDPEISLECVTPNDNNFVSGANEVLSSMLSHVDRANHKVLGGINTDFGGGAGPQGAFWKGGECLKETFAAMDNRPRFFVSISKDKTVEMGTEAEYKDYVAENGSDISELFCGSPKLVEDGKVNVTVPNNLDEESHPRTAIGVMPDKTTVYLMVVDGRRYTYSNGMYLSVLADMFAALGCEHALNLDGGGSSTFIVAGDGELGDPARMQVKNWPNDGGGVERHLNNGLAIIANTK